MRGPPSSKHYNLHTHTNSAVAHARQAQSQHSANSVHFLYRRSCNLADTCCAHLKPVYLSACLPTICASAAPQIKWDAAPNCRSEPTLINSMADAEGRLWGWHDDVREAGGGENCRFVGVDGKPVMHQDLLAAVIKLASVQSTELTP